MDNKIGNTVFFRTKVIILGLLPIILYLFGLNLLVILSMEVLAVLIFCCLKDISSNIFFLVFLCSFFVFLMSGDIVSELTGTYYYLQFSEAATRHCWLAILISLVFLYLGYSSKKRPIKFREKTVFNRVDVKKIRYAAKIAYYLTYVVLLFNTVDIIRFVAIHGYVAYYSSYTPFLPSIIAELADFTPIALCVYLATFPSKKEATLPIGLFLLYAVLSLFIGARGGLIYNMAFLLGYMLYRNKHDKDGEIWLPKKIIALVCISIPFVLVFLFLYGYIRLGQDIKYESFVQTLIDFFVNIGASSKTIKFGYECKSTIENFRFYSLGDTLNYFRYGKLFNLFDLGSIPSVHSEQFALEGHSFDAYLSYRFMQTQYLNGEGMGSSYIAVLYADFGYIGVAVGSFVYGRLFKALSYLNENSWLSTCIKLYCFLFLVKAPRGSFDGFLGGIVNINFWVLILGILFLSNLVKGRKNGIE